MMKLLSAMTRSLRRTCWIVAVCCLAVIFPGAARAQRAAGTSSQLDVSVDYSYVHASSPNTAFGDVLQGGSVSVAYKFHWHWGVAGDFGGYVYTGLNPGSTAELTTYMVGPRYTVGSSNRFSPFVQVLAGGSRLTAHFGSSEGAENGFAMAVGGGVDVRVGHHIAVRVLQAEYLMTRFWYANTGDENQNTLRLSAGIVFRLGVR
jgi:hypothetical protein